MNNEKAEKLANELIKMHRTLTDVVGRSGDYNRVVASAKDATQYSNQDIEDAIQYTDTIASNSKPANKPAEKTLTDLKKVRAVRGESSNHEVDLSELSEQPEQQAIQAKTVVGATTEKILGNTTKSQLHR